MAKQLQKQYEKIIQKQEVLNTAKQQLKKEFIGIDHVIDEVVDALSSWYLFPDLQEKPVVVNLWGLTGTGKSSLINRLAQLLHYNERYYRFDLGENGLRGWAIKGQLEDIYENENGYPVLIALDEFQHARTVNEMGEEVDKTASRIIWQLLDSGKFQISRYNHQHEEIYDLLLKLRHFLRAGVRVSKGRVKAKKEYFIKQMDLQKEYEAHTEDRMENNKSNILFVPVNYHESIFFIAKEKFASPFDVRSRLMELNGYETIKFLLDILAHGNSPKTVDCSKSLIFVLGNLDEAYTMSHNFNPDMDADEFHEQSLKINVPIIKRVLKKRFRSEQIARLGNMHIIYPAFTKASFKRIIELELSKIAKKIYKQQKIQFQFDQSIHDLIYKEGVYPTQGTRPIFSTIHQIINTKLGKVFTEMILNDLAVSQIVFKTKDDLVIAEYMKEGSVIHALTIRQHFNLEKLRRNKKDDLQAISAVHEAGHAIISSVLLRTVPEVIFSNTAEVGSAGFIYTKFKWNYISRKEIKNRLALFFGGYIAEKIIFGEDNITTGAESDIEKATTFITEMLKQCGMGQLPASYNVKDPQTLFQLHDVNNKVNEEAETWLKSALDLAEKTLREQEVLLLKMADYLSDNRSMTKVQTKEMLYKFAANFSMDELIENGDCLFYRNHLKKRVLSFRKSDKPSVNAETFVFSLNKKSL